jgi:hypothetical protein
MRILSQVNISIPRRIIGNKWQSFRFGFTPLWRKFMSGRTRLTGISTSSAAYGARGTSADLIPFPERSILAASEAPLKPLDLAKARLNKAFLLALAINFLAWFFVLLAGRAIASVFI